eukprot:1541343-Pleurochrysis_carterae.AAC.2
MPSELSFSLLIASLFCARVQSAACTSLLDCTFNRCASRSGAALQILHHGCLQLTDCLVANCTADYGSGLAVANCNHCQIHGTTFEACTAAVNYGALDVSDSLVVATDCRFFECSAPGAIGGGACARRLSTLNLTNVLFDRCPAVDISSPPASRIA